MMQKYINKLKKKERICLSSWNKGQKQANQTLPVDENQSSFKACSHPNYHLGTHSIFLQRNKNEMNMYLLI